MPTGRSTLMALRVFRVLPALLDLRDLLAQLDRLEPKVIWGPRGLQGRHQQLLDQPDLKVI